MSIPKFLLSRFFENVIFGLRRLQFFVVVVVKCFFFSVLFSCYMFLFNAMQCLRIIPLYLRAIIEWHFEVLIGALIWFYGIQAFKQNGMSYWCSVFVVFGCVHLSSTCRRCIFNGNKYAIFFYRTFDTNASFHRCIRSIENRSAHICTMLINRNGKKSNWTYRYPISCGLSKMSDC